ncbi:MAG TPA: phosphatase PAP2 family protein [Blastocatellia bacterium]|nr:phosphatase PAP2 family protein [Blastocatellia bacterium]
MAEERATNEEPGLGGGAEALTVSPRRAVRRARGAEVVFGAFLCFYIVLAVLAHRYAYFEWDLSAALRIQSITFPLFKTLMLWVSVLGNGWVPFVLVTGTGFALAAARFRTEAAVCMVGVAAGALINRLLKMLSDRPRPDESLVQIFATVKHESFPSGHVVLFVEFFGLLFFFSYVLLKRGPLRRLALFTTGALIVLIGVSRVYLGAHWPSDVAGAYLAGGVWLMVMIEVYRRMKEGEGPGARGRESGREQARE